MSMRAFGKTWGIAALPDDVEFLEKMDRQFLHWHNTLLSKGYLVKDYDSYLLALRERYEGSLSEQRVSDLH